jgi:hypothetical protein
LRPNETLSSETIAPSGITAATTLREALGRRRATRDVGAWAGIGDAASGAFKRIDQRAQSLERILVEARQHQQLRPGA